MTRVLRGLAPGLFAFAAGCAGMPGPGPGPAAGPAFPDADSVFTRETAPGVIYTRVWDARGPWAIHVLHMDRTRCRPVLRAAKAGPALSARAATSALAGGALAAINADFFELPGGTPVGPHVSGGVVWIGPGQRPVLAITDAGLVQGAARIDGWIAARGDTTVVVQVNRRRDSTRVGTGARFLTRRFAGDSTTNALRLRRIVGDTRQGRGVVEAGSVPVASPDPDGILIAEGEAWSGRRAPGDTVEWSIRLVVEGSTAPVAEAVGGFPALVRNGRVVLAGQPGVRPEFGERRHPRTAVGWNAASLFWIVVDGRQAPRSDGMTLAELAALFLRLGATEALNLDGGGSSAMVLEGRLVNRPSDAQGERAVGNALLLEWCAAGRDARTGAGA